MNDLLGSPGLLRSAARDTGLTTGEIDCLKRPRVLEAELEDVRWTNADIPLLDEFWSLVGGLPSAMAEEDRQRVRDARDEFEIAAMQDELLENDPGLETDDDSATVVATRVLPPHRSGAIVSDANEPYPFESDDDIEIRELDIESIDAFADARITVGELAGENESWRYGHVIVDEAQDLTPMQWRMVMRRVRGRALTIVGDLAQRSASVAQDWQELLPPELASAQRQDLTVNYRSPAEIHALAVAVLADFAPSVAPSRAIRSSGWAPEFVQVDQLSDGLDAVVDSALDSVGGQVAVIAMVADSIVSSHRRDDEADSRVRFLTPNQSKGLEFDAVVLVEPAQIIDRQGGPSQLYIALTRATQRLTVLYSLALPPVLT